MQNVYADMLNAEFSDFFSSLLCFQKELMKESLEIVIPKLLHAATDSAAKVNS